MNSWAQACRYKDTIVCHYRHNDASCLITYRAVSVCHMHPPYRAVMLSCQCPDACPASCKLMAVLQTERLPVFWKQRRMLFFDAFSFAFPTFLQRLPFSLTEAVVWTVLSYFPVGLAGEPGRYSSALCLFSAALCHAVLYCAVLCCHDGHAGKPGRYEVTVRMADLHAILRPRNLCSPLLVSIAVVSIALSQRHGDVYPGRAASTRFANGTFKAGYTGHLALCLRGHYAAFQGSLGSGTAHRLASRSSTCIISSSFLSQISTFCFLSCMSRDAAGSSCSWRCSS